MSGWTPAQVLLAPAYAWYFVKDAAVYRYDEYLLEIISLSFILIYQFLFIHPKSPQILAKVSRIDPISVLGLFLNFSSLTLS